MKKTLILFLAIAATSLTALGQTVAPTSVTGAGAATFPAGATLSGVSLSSMRFGLGVAMAADGTASGDFQGTLLGAQSRRIRVVGKASSATATLLGVPTISGTCTLDLGDGTAPASLPFAVTVAKATNGTWSLTLALGSTTLPAAPVTSGSVSVQ
ncbi:MAG TPA: hypothetical protein VJZ76_18360 [Thermoanaerobaculia bacterium]|nr:hypothetical protein [Thermoanaerobaculia bacterium]